MNFYLTLLSLGAFVGLSLGLTGSGGAILAIPLLVYGAKVPMDQAVTLSLIIVGCIAAFGAVRQSFAKKTDWRIAVMFSLFGMLVSPITIILAKNVNQNLRLGLFAFLMLIAAWSMAKSPPTTMKSGISTQSKINQYIWIALGGAFTGILSGFFGVGGGFVIIPLLNLIFAIPYSQAVGTSLACIFMISFSALIGQIFERSLINFDILITFIAGGIVGLLIGIATINIIAEQTAKYIFSLTIGVLAIFISINIFFSNQGGIL